MLEDGSEDRGRRSKQSDGSTKWLRIYSRAWCDSEAWVVCVDDLIYSDVDMSFALEVLSTSS